MAFFVLCSDITIGQFRFSGVHEVRIKRSLHSVVEQATIKIPSISKIVRNGKADPETVITGHQFNDGDPVTINLGYNDSLLTEFQGFVKRRNLDMPLEIECEGYSWLLKRNIIKKFSRSTSVKELLNLAVSGIDSKYPISIKCEEDIELGNVTINNKSGFDIIEDIAKNTDNCLTCFFIEPGVLWCGLVYTPYAAGNDVFGYGTVNYRLGYNVTKNNSLRERTPDDDPVLVTYAKKLKDGSKLSAASDAFKKYVRAHDKILNRLQDDTALKTLANEKANKLNYAGYEGRINGFLQPFASPGHKANIIDDRYGERNGVYVIESTEVIFGTRGARRVVEIGPKVST